MFTFKFDRLYEDVEARKAIVNNCIKKVDESNSIVALKHITSRQIRIDNHFHDWLEFSLVVEGEQEVTIGEQTYMATTNDFYMVDYNVIHGNATLNKDVSKITFQLKRSYIKKLAPVFLSKNIYCRSMGIDSAEEHYKYAELIKCYLYMMELFYKEDAVSQMGFEGMLKVFLYMLMENFTLSDEELERKTKKESHHIQVILAYMHNHYHEEVTLSRLSEELYLAPKYISKLIKNELNINFKEYLMKIRMNHAVYEMLHSDKSLSDICYGCGFTSQKSFIEYFKKEYGQTPNRFRTMKQK